MTKNSSELEMEGPRNGNLLPQIVPIQAVPLGDQKKAVLRQELMVLLMNLGMLIGGMSLALPAVTLDHLTNPSESFHMDRSQASWYASASSIACPVGSFTGAFLVDKIGRKFSLVMLNIFGIIAWTLMSTAYYEDATLVFIQLMISRLFSGVATGMGGSPASVYGAEICLPTLRARLMMAPSMAIGAGVLFAYIVGYFIRNDWHFIGIIYLGYNIVCLILLIPVKESPSWLLSKGRVEEAKASLSYFRGLEAGETHEEVEEEFATLKHSIPSKAGQKRASFWKSLRLPEVYKPFSLAFIFFLFQQFSGTFVIVVYAVQIITKAGVLIDPFLCAIYVGIARFVVSTFVMTWELEKWDRRTVSILSAASTSFCLFLLAGSSWFTWLQIPTLTAAIIVGFVVASAGQWNVPYVILPEIFPQKVRGSLVGASVGISYVISFSSIKLYPSLVDWMGSGNVFAFYGTVAILSILFVHQCIPETKGKTFIEIEDYFRTGKKTLQENEIELETTEVLVVKAKDARLN